MRLLIWQQAISRFELLFHGDCESLLSHHGEMRVLPCSFPWHFLNSVLMAVPHSLIRRFWAGAPFEGLGSLDLAGIIIFWTVVSWGLCEIILCFDSHSWGVRVLGPELYPPDCLYFLSQCTGLGKALIWFWLSLSLACCHSVVGEWSPSSRTSIWRSGSHRWCWPWSVQSECFFLLLSRESLVSE